MPLSIERRLATLFGLGVTVLALIGGAAWWSLSRFEMAFERVAHTHEVLNGLEQILVDALNVQSGSRGYALSGDVRFLEPFDDGVRRIHASIDSVRALTDDDPRQSAALDELRPLVARLIELMQSRNDALAAGAGDEAVDPGLLYAGKEAMDRIRVLIERMSAHELALLAQRSRNLRKDSARTRAILLLAVAVSLVVAAAVGTRMQREFAARRRADAALQRSRTVFQTLFEQATDALIVVDSRGVIRRVNRRTEDLFGWARHELLGKSVEQLMPRRFAATHASHRAAFAEAPKFRAMGAGLDLFALRKDGVEFPVDIMLSPLETEEGKVVLAAIRDITERKAAAIALQRSAEQIRDLYNLAPCGYHSLDANAVFLAINDTELNWLGYTREEVIGRMKFSDLLTDESRRLFARTFPEFLASGRAEGIEFEMRRKDGSTFFVSLSETATRDESGRYVSSRSTVHDISARREAERRLAGLHAELQRHTLELAAANEQLEAFNYSVSHDLRAPLRHMSGFAAILREHLGEKLDAESSRYLGVISGAAARMGRLIDDLLKFSRLGRTPVVVSEVDADALVRGLIDDGSIEAAPGTEWRIGPLPRVQADPSLLQQVWVNLLGNAAKYAAKSSPPIIEVDAEVRAEAGEIEFRVRDNGVGFDPQQADRLFGVFSRLHPEAEFSGTGVGLALVKRIISRHGGRVGASGERGRGALFWFTLPVQRGPSA